MALGFGIGIPFIRRRGAAIDAQAQAHFDRVIADGGLVPSGLSGVNAFFTTVKSIYATADITTAISVGLDAQVLGYKLGAGAGTTAGQAAQKLYSCSGASGDVVQTTAASQPLLLVHSGENYWQGVGVAGNYCETPNAAANQITGDIDIIAKVNFLSNSTQDQIVIKSNAVAGSSFCYGFFKDANNLKFAYSNDGTVAGRTISSSSATISSTGYTYGTDIWVRVTRAVSSGDVKFYYGSDGVTWTQLGTTQSTTANTIANAAIPLRIGNWTNILYFFTGKIYRATISNSIGGAPVVDFNPNQYNAANSQTQWTSSTGEVWTINTGTATTGYKGVLVDRTIVQGDAIDDKLTCGATFLNNHTNYTAYKALVQDGTGNRIVYANGTTNFVNTISALSTNMVFLSLTPAIFQSPVTKVFQTLGLSTAVFGTNATKVKVNNGSFGATLTGAYVGGNGYSLFGAATIHFGNNIITSSIVSVTNDTSIQNTAMYDYIKSINNNAF
jgi:hypothetical protein